MDKLLTDDQLDRLAYVAWRETFADLGVSDADLRKVFLRMAAERFREPQTFRRIAEAVLAELAEIREEERAVGGVGGPRTKVGGLTLGTVTRP